MGAGIQRSTLPLAALSCIANHKVAGSLSLLSISMSEMTSKFFFTFQYHIVLSQYYQISPDSSKYQSSRPKLPEAHCCSTAVGCNHSWSSTRPPSTKSSQTSARRQHGRYHHQEQQRHHHHQTLCRMIKRLGGAVANKAVQGGGEIVRRISRYSILDQQVFNDILNFCRGKKLKLV